MRKLVALMFLRTPAFERMHNKIGEELHRFRNRFIFNSPEKVQKMLDALPESVRSTDLATAKEIFKFAQQGEYNVKFHRNASLEMMLEFAVEFTPIFAKLNWIIGHTPATARFVIALKKSHLMKRLSVKKRFLCVRCGKILRK